MERVVLGADPTPLGRLIWSLVLIFIFFLPFISVFAVLCIWGERKVAGHMQCRPGPNRVGPFGLLQSFADGLKLLVKEDLRPAAADSFLFRVAPYLAFVPVFVAFLALPWGPDFTYEPALGAGLFWILAVLSLEIMGVIAGGWGSNNKWSVYGAMREGCQMVSYEIPLGIAIIVGVMTAGTLNLVELGHIQSGGIHTWIVFRNPFVFLAFFVYFVASLASNKRAPFDLPEAESELVAGFHTEYSGLRWSFFFFGEYAAMFAVGGIQAALFLGGWNDPFGLIGYYHQRWSATGFTAGLIALNFAAGAIFISKAVIIVLVQMWLRWTLPRPRIDQVLYACMKVLMPMACVLLLGGAVWQWLIFERPGLPWESYRPWDLAGWWNEGFGAALASQLVLSLVGVVMVTMVVGWIAYAWLTRHSVQKRLSEPAPIENA
jgi:NADH-quinone oxidoreductase subunit H